MNSNRQVVITGMGVVCPIGIGVEQYWQSLLDGKSGVRVREEYRDTELPLRIYAPVNDFDGKKFVKPRKAMKVMCQPIQFGFAAAAMAVEQAGLGEDVCDPDRYGTVFGSETFFADPMEVASVFRKCVTEQHYDHDRWGEFAMREIQPLWMLKYLPNMVTAHISIANDARGPCNSICQGEVSGLLALVEGATLIRRGICDVVVVGGTGSQTSISSVLYRGQHEMSRRIHEPEKASRPFDRDRDGMVLGEGAGAVVLESEQFANQRGANIVSRVLGWSREFASPKSKNFSAAIESNLRATLDNSQLSPEMIGHVNAHGTGMVDPDTSEALALARVFNETPVATQKANFGLIGPGGPVIELIASLQANVVGQLPANINTENPDPSCPLNLNDRSSLKPSATIKTSISSTGQIVSVAVSR